jgi:anti-anti-sigma regulatory factor
MSDREAILVCITRITASLATVRSLDALAKAIQGSVDETVSIQYSGVYMTDFATGQLRLWYTKGFTEEEHKEAERTAWDRHPGWVIRHKQLLHIPDTLLDDRSQSSKRAFQVRSRLWLPIMNKGEAVGSIGVASTIPHAFTTEHITILQYAAETSGFMYENLRDKWSLEQQLLIAEERRQELIALSSPLVEVWNGVVVLPVIGRMGETRAQQMTEKLLAIVASRGLRAVILDLTGVATIDATSIEYLGRVHRAVRLLGSECIFSGISGQTAALMTQLGVDLGAWKTFATVRQAIGTFSGGRQKS